MYKKIFLLGSIAFIVLFVMSYVSATAEIQTNIDFEDLEEGSIDQYKDIQLSNEEEKVLKDGKRITKKVNVVKEVKTYSKTKSIKIECSKKLTKKNIKNGKMGGQYEKNVRKARSVLKDSKIKSIKITTTYKKLRDCSGIHKVKIYKATIKYQPVKMVKVFKSTIVTIKLKKYTNANDEYIEFSYINPFSGKKEYEYGDIIYY